MASRRSKGRAVGRAGRAGALPSCTWTRVAPVSSGAASVLRLVVLGRLGVVEQVVHAPCELPFEGAERLGAVLPAVSRRWRNACACGQTRSWVIAIRCSAALSCRLPPRFSRCRCTLPDEAGMGATPACMAKAASDLNRRTSAVSTSSLAAHRGPQPDSVSSCGAWRCTRTVTWRVSWSTWVVRTRIRLTSSVTIATSTGDTPTGSGPSRRLTWSSQTA
jgi:hypothetical protein